MSISCLSVLCLSDSLEIRTRKATTTELDFIFKLCGSFVKLLRRRNTQAIQIMAAQLQWTQQPRCAYDVVCFMLQIGLQWLNRLVSMNCNEMMKQSCSQIGFIENGIEEHEGRVTAYMNGFYIVTFKYSLFLSLVLSCQASFSFFSPKKLVFYLVVR